MITLWRPTLGAALALLLAGAVPARAAAGLALTPPMGWNSWNKFGCNVSERLMRETGAIKASRDLEAEGVLVEVIWKGPIREDDREPGWRARARLRPRRARATTGGVRQQAHDFPQGTLYWLDDKGALHARIEGTTGGHTKHQEGVFTRR